MADTLILCATTRLAQILRGEAPEGQRVWRTRQALTLGQWLGSLADEALVGGSAELPTPLDAFAESLLWEKIVSASLSEAAALFDLPGMAAAAAEAQALCRIWKLRPGGSTLSDEARLFVGWQAEFEKRCRASGWIDAAGLQRQLIALIADGQFALPARVIFAGFDRYTPLERDLMAALAARGVELENQPEFPVDPGASSWFAGRSVARVVALPDPAAECAAVVAWAQARLAADPACRIGIVAPDLAAIRDRLEFLLDDVLHPALIRPELAESPRCFNFSLGRPLAELPLVRTALDLLALGNGRAKVEQQRLSQLLLRGGWGAAEAEADGRARLDAVLRRELPYFTRLPALLALGERHEGLCPASLKALGELAGVIDAAPRRLPPGKWGGLFRQALAAAGWPGDRPLSSHEFQARRAFVEVLDGFGQLDGLLGSVTYAEAVSRLGQLGRQRLFQPETRGRPAIQVLGVLESAGLDFDALWVMGMNDDRWPPPPRPNPLLPAELQRSAGSAHASAEVELDFARRVHQRLLHSAPDVTLSWSRADGNRVLRPSPLLAGLPIDETLPAPALATVATHLAAEAPAAVERLDDAVAPPLGAGETVRGGTWLLRAQAICPAWAFYQFRLGGEALDEAVEGLDPAARGTLVHGALEAFWTAVRSSAELAALDQPARDAAIATAVETAIAAFERKERISLPARFRQLEAERLARLLALWLPVEGKRGQAFEVLACEQKTELDIEGIRVRMVVDRVDRLADGRQVIIDYKTGTAIDTRNWAEARITEPQLPIYAALVNQDVAAVVFAKVLLDKPGFAGVAEEKDILPGIQGVGDDKQKLFDPARFPDWAAVVAHWRESLLAVAREVRGGQAGVVFADEKKLQYCEVLPLLRLAERRRLLAEAQGSADA